MARGEELQLNSLRRSFGGGAGVEDVSLQVEAGTGFSLLGPSGCGKTTTLRMIAGFEKPEQGSIRLGGRDITRLAPQARDVRTVFQRYALFPHLSVSENVAFGLKMKGCAPAETKTRMLKALDLMEIPHLAARRVHQLSGGEQQRVALARAVVTEPSVLLLDEPLSALDLKLRERMQLELLTLRRRIGSTFIFVTHDQTEAMVLSDRIGVMNRGRLEQVGPPEEIYGRPKTRFVASFIGQANFLTSEQAPLMKGAKGPMTELRPGQAWMLRPEKLGLVAQPGAGTVALQVQVQEVAFLGQYRLAKVLDATGAQHLVRLEPSDELKSQSDAWMAWKSEDAWTVDP